MATILLFIRAYRMTGAGRYRTAAHTAFRWFMGHNVLRLSLFDHETGGCCDGLERGGVNRNQGAESTLAYLIAYLAVEPTFEKKLTRQIISKTDESSYARANRLADTTP